MNKITIEVAYAAPEKQHLISLNVCPGTSVAQAILSSEILQHLPDLNLQNLKVGIFSKPCTLETIVNANDRIEIYRPLLIDPKAARRAKAKNLKK